MLTTTETIQEPDQAARLKEVLPRWLERVPLYQRPAYARNSRDGEFSIKRLQRLPFITKDDLRKEFPRNFLPEGTELDSLLDQDLLEVEQTSGTSEARAPLLMARGWWRAQEMAALRQNASVAKILDTHPDARRVTINSPVCNGDISYSSIPTHAERIVGDSFFVNLSRHPFLWTETELARMAAEAVEWGPVFLDVDPVYGALFAQYCERQKIQLPSLRFILCTYEFVSVVHRRILERVFGVPVFNLYGSTETGHLMMENERGEMLPSLETAFMEIVDPDVNGIGDLVVTTLTNDFMPLIRYRIGDLVQRRNEIYIVHGRARDAFRTRMDSRVTTWHIDECFADIAGITHYQLLQRADEWVLRYAKDGAGPGAAQLDTLHQRLLHMLELKRELELEQTDLLMPEASGKFLLGYPAKN